MGHSLSSYKPFHIVSLFLPLLAVDAFGLLTKTSSAFILRPTSSSIPKGTTFYASNSADTAGRANITFHGDFSYTSKTIVNVPKEEFLMYFKSRDTKNLLASGGGEKKLEELSITDDCRSIWRETCAMYGLNEVLNEDEDAITTSTTEIQFPGLTLLNTVMTLVKHAYDEVPQYEFYLMAEKRETKGPSPIVWLFNKLTGAEPEEKRSFIPSKQGMAASKVYIVDKDGDFAVQFDLEMSVVVKFPAVLLKVLPTSKEKMEQQGSESVIKAVSKEIIPAVDKVVEKFYQWQENERVKI